MDNDKLSGWPTIPIINVTNMKPERTGPTLKSDRPTWDEIWFEIADIISTRSLCSKAKIGCVIVAEDQTVISCSYNGPPPGYAIDGTDTRCKHWCKRYTSGDNDSSYSTCPSNHAEANAVVRADWSRIKGATAYVTGSCCFTCAKLLAAAGIKRVVHRVNEHETYRNPKQVETFLCNSGVQVDRI